jgi:hypothetical protein
VSTQAEHYSVPVEELNDYALDVRSVNYDWSDGYGEDWNLFSPDEEDGEEDGPMMNYYYELPVFNQIESEAAAKLDGLPLCLVEVDDRYALALTGGGMDLSWEICEAFMRLGYLPPVSFCDLPAMCGRGTLSSGGEYGGKELSERDAWIIEGCKRALALQKEHSTRRLDYVGARLENL